MMIRKFPSQASKGLVNGIELFTLPFDLTRQRPSQFDIFRKSSFCSQSRYVPSTSYLPPFCMTLSLTASHHAKFTFLQYPCSKSSPYPPIMSTSTSSTILPSNGYPKNDCSKWTIAFGSLYLCTRKRGKSSGERKVDDDHGWKCSRWKKFRRKSRRSRS